MSESLEVPWMRHREIWPYLVAWWRHTPPPRRLFGRKTTTTVTRPSGEEDVYLGWYLWLIGFGVFVGRDNRVGLMQR